MDNAMVKRGIGAVVLAIIAALLLGYLLKDKSAERQQIVDMKLPGAPEITIPSLSDATNKLTDSAASLVGEAKDSLSNAGSAVIDSATGTSNAEKAITDDLTSKSSTEEKIADTSEASSTATDPGFSFRPPSQNEEQEINTADSTASTKITETKASTEANTSNNTVVASTKKTKAVKEFKPVIESEPKKVVKKAVRKKTVIKKAEANSKTSESSTSTSSKYTLQLLATSSQSRANKLAKTMNSEGYVSFITQTTSNNKILYRVRVGGHKDRSSALSAQQAMKRRYQKNFFVQNSLVVSQ